MSKESIARLTRRRLRTGLCAVCDERRHPKYKRLCLYHAILHRRQARVSMAKRHGRDEPYSPWEDKKIGMRPYVLEFSR